MASITYSGDFGTTSAGSNGKTYAVSGSALPSNAYITSINYTLSLSSGGYSSSNKWQLHWFAIGSSSGSPYVSATSASMSSTRHTFSGNMKFTQSDVSKFTSGSFTLYCKANSSHSSTSYLKGFTITVNYTIPSLGTPAAPTITQNTNGTFTASWSAVSGSGGSGSVTYRLQNLTDGAYLNTASTSTSLTADIGAYGTAIQYRVVAYYSNLTKYGSSTTKTFVLPSLTTPTLSISAASGVSATLSWTAASLSQTAGTISYAVLLNGTQIGTTSSRTFIVTQSGNYTVKAIATGLSNTDAGSTLTKTTAAVVFTYVSPDKTIAYFDGTQWIDCLVYYFDGSNWVKCEVYYFDGSSWNACNTGG